MVITKDVSFGCGGASVALGTFQDNQELIVVRELTVQCLLGGGLHGETWGYDKIAEPGVFCWVRT